MSQGREKPMKNMEDWKIPGESAVLNTKRKEFVWVWIIIQYLVGYEFYIVVKNNVFNNVECGKKLKILMLINIKWKIRIE